MAAPLPLGLYAVYRDRPDDDWTVLPLSAAPRRVRAPALAGDADPGRGVVRADYPSRLSKSPIRVAYPSRTSELDICGTRH